MPAMKHILLIPAAVLLTFLMTACGGSSNSPTPQGTFNSASLNGSYAFSFNGSDSRGSFGVAGFLQADGAGHISSGVLDTTRLPQPAVNVALTGTYAVHADGRGTATLNSTAGNINLNFVIVSAQRALISRFENSATGSGSMDLQNSGAFSTTALAGTFVFNLSGVDGVQNTMATVGSITTNAAGTITTGIQDISDNGTINDGATTTPGLAISGGTLAMASNGRGTVVMNTALGALNFAVYVVDANHLRLVEIDPQPGFSLTGEAFRQQGTISIASISGPFAFTAAGLDLAAGPTVAGGILSTDGEGNIPRGTIDLNDAGSFGTGFAVTGTYSMAANGRGTLTFSNPTVGTLTFAVYPTTNGLQLLELDSLFTVSGAALQQTGTFGTNSISGNYAVNFTAASGNGPVDSVATLNADGAGHFRGIIDINDAFTPTSGNSMFGTYSLDSTGRGPMTMNTGLGPQSLAVYTVSSTRALFIEVDGSLVSVGEMEHQ